MALVISIKDGGDFYVKDQRFVVTNAKSTSFAIVEMVGDYPGMCRHVDDSKMIEIYPGVKVSCGLGNYVDYGTKKYVARVVFEAARDIIILRGDMYRRGK
jgi:hypothetical protein